MSEIEETDLQRADHAYEFKNWKLAFALYKKILKEEPNGHVYYRLGVMYKNGHYAKQSERKSKKFFKKAFEKLTPLATEGECEALCDLGSMFEYGEGVNKNHEKAVDYYLKAAEKGYASAQCNLGYMFNNGRGVKIDREKAVEYYKLASKQNHVRAQYNLGYLYRYGQGVPQDFQQAVLFYRKSAEQGYTKAQHNLGFMFSNGFGVDKDKKMAAYYYKLAADQKNAMSSYNLALMFQKGEGVEKNLSMAFKYFLEATELGHRDAKAQLDKINKNSDDEYKRAAQIHAANEWPDSHKFLCETCQVSVVELFLIMRYNEVPVELVLIAIRLMIKEWPMGNNLIRHYLKQACEKTKKKSG